MLFKFDHDEVSSQARFDTVVSTIAGDRADPQTQDWIRDNIVSINEAVQGGSHDALWYPASGIDILRTTFAYDATEAIGIDNAETIKQLKDRLEEGEFHYSIVEDSDAKFSIVIGDGKKVRRITVLNRDARLADPSDLGLNRVDVLHIYLPTGATEFIKEVDPLTGLEVQRGKPVQPHISSYNLNLVNEGGFLCFGEKEFVDDPIPESFLKLVGLKRHDIVKRHPYFISTSYFPMPEELQEMEKRGVVYQKVRDVVPDIGDLAFDILSTIGSQAYVLMEFTRGNVEYLAINREMHVPLEDYMRSVVSGWRRERHELLSRFRELSIDDELLSQIEYEFDLMFREKLEATQRNLREFMHEFEQLSIQHEAGEISGAEALGQLGVKERRYGGYESKKYPLAPVVAMGYGDSDFVVQIVEEFINIDVTSL